MMAVGHSKSIALTLTHTLAFSHFAQCEDRKNMKERTSVLGNNTRRVYLPYR